MTNQNGAAPRRIAITGRGAVTPLGNDVASAWETCREGRSGVATIRNFDASELPVRIAAEVKSFDAAAALGAKHARRLSRVIHFAMVAAREAVAESGLDIAANPYDVGVVMGCGVGGLEVCESQSLVLHERGWRRVSPFTVPGMIPNMPAGMIALDQGARGNTLAIATACATGADAIGEAAELIRRGDCTAVIAGGAESGVTGIGLASFAIMQALSASGNDDPERASRPFDKARDGFVIGEGAAAVILEDLEHAKARGATILAEVVGYGSTNDAHHMTAPDPEGTGAVRCVQRALQRAGKTPRDVDYISAHGTSTSLNDVMETRAIKAVFGDHAYKVPMSSVKSMTGHMLGAAAAWETLVCVQAINDHWLPPTINLDTPDPECDLDYVANVGRAASPKLCLNTAFGFGGHNACLAIAAYQE